MSTQVLLFPGYKTHTKRYKNFIYHLEKRSHTVQIVNSDSTSLKHENLQIIEQKPIQIVAHSLGVLNAIIWCHEHNIQPSLIISLDGSYLNPDILRERIDQKEDEIQQVYQKYLDITDIFPIVLFRSSVDRDPTILEQDESYYTEVHYYQDGHYPYNYPSVRDKIINMLI